LGNKAYQSWGARLLRGELAHRPIVDDQQRWLEIRAQPRLPRAIGVTTAKIAQQPAGLGEQHPVTLSTRLMTKCFGQMGFADADRSAQQDVLLAHQLATGGQIA